MVIALIFIGVNFGKQTNSVIPDSAEQFWEQERNARPQIVPGVVMVKIKSREVAHSLSKATTITGLASLDAKLSQLRVLNVEKAFRHKPIPANSGIPDISRILKVSIPD